MYTVKHAAFAAGITPSTLRAWERRYSVVSPHRTPAGYRLYDDAAIARLRAMVALIAAGWGTSQAAQRVLAEAETAATTTEALGRPVGELASCAMTMDAARLDRTLDEVFSRTDVENLIDRWLLPALHEVGVGYEAGDVTVAGEHLVSAAVFRRLAAAFDTAPVTPGSPRVLAGLPPSSRHELGLLAFATVLRRHGVNVQYVGAALPVFAWVDAVEATDPAAVVIAAPTFEDVDGTRAAIAELSSAFPDVPVYVGGGAQHGLDGVAALLGHDLVAAARTLAAEVLVAV